MTDLNELERLARASVNARGTQEWEAANEALVGCVDEVTILAVINRLRKAEAESERLTERLAASNGMVDAYAGKLAGSRFQSGVADWMQECFGPVIAKDKVERNHRFLEEALELVQACDCTSDEAHKLVDYVYGRPVGEKSQEVGGVLVTLAALCLAQDIEMQAAGDTELARITQPDVVLRIREKQKRKPALSPLPGCYPERQQIAAALDLSGSPEGRQLPPGYVAIPEAALKWLFGEEGDFVPPADQRLFRGKIPAYWWRTEFRRRIKQGLGHVKFGSQEGM